MAQNKRLPIAMILASFIGSQALAEIPNAPLPTELKKDAELRLENKPSKFRESLSKYIGGSSITTRYRNQEANDGTKKFDRQEYQLDLKVNIELNESGTVKLKARALTGSRHDLGWGPIGGKTNGQDTDFAPKTGLRLLYIDAQATKDVQIQAGAMPVLPDQATIGEVARLDADGWVDGVRGVFTNNVLGAEAVSITVGRVGDYTKVNAWERADSLANDPNFIQVHIRAKINDRITAMGEGTKLDQEEYLRAVAEVTVNDVVKFVDKIVLEEMIANGDQTHQAFAVSLKKNMGKWSHTAQYSHKVAAFNPNVEGSLPMEDIYGAGHQLTYKGALALHGKPGKDNGKLILFLGKNVNQGTKFFGMDGVRLQVGYKYTWK